MIDYSSDFLIKICGKIAISSPRNIILKPIDTDTDIDIILPNDLSIKNYEKITISSPRNIILKPIDIILPNDLSIKNCGKTPVSSPRNIILKPIGVILPNDLSIKICGKTTVSSPRNIILKPIDTDISNQNLNLIAKINQNRSSLQSPITSIVLNQSNLISRCINFSDTQVEPTFKCCDLDNFKSSITQNDINKKKSTQLPFSLESELDHLNSNKKVHLNDLVLKSVTLIEPIICDKKIHLNDLVLKENLPVVNPLTLIDQKVYFNDLVLKEDLKVEKKITFTF
jgi:hypothetical protein